MSKPKVGRNEACPCGSGQKYKYCCIGNQGWDTVIQKEKDSASNGVFSVEMTTDILKAAARTELPLKNYCKDNGFYFFSMAITVGELAELTQKLKLGTLTKNEVIEVYRSNAKRDSITTLLERCCTELAIFENRRRILFDAFEAHFDRKYTLSIPTLFSQLEGLLREVGGLKNKDTIKSTIPKDIWDKKLLFNIKDNAEYFSCFVNNIFEGSKEGDGLNRNPILHGFRTNYDNEEDSLIILLAVLEIRMFAWWKINIPDFT